MKQIHLLISKQMLIRITQIQYNISNKDAEAKRLPESRQPKTMSKIINNRYLNQNIYTTFLQKRFGDCLGLIERSKTADQFKIYIKSLIEKSSYKLDKSLELLNQCHIMNKLNYSYLKSISKNYFLLGKYKSSLEVAKEAHRMNSTDYQIFYIFGKISMALDDSDSALTYFKSAIGKEPNQESFIQQAKIYMKKNQYIQASDTLKDCSLVAPENPEVFEMLGLCHSKLGKNDEAYQAYKQALQVDASRYVSLVGIGSIELQRDQIEEALESFKKAYKTSNNSAVLWNNIGISMSEKKKLLAAYCCFKRALFLDPFRWNFHVNLALLFIKKEKFLPAKIHIQSALKLYKDPSLFNILGVCLLELKDFVNAEKAFQGALKMNQSFFDAKFNLLMCFHKSGKKDKSRQLFEEIERYCPDEHLKDRLLDIKNQIYN